MSAKKRRESLLDALSWAAEEAADNDISYADALRVLDRSYNRKAQRARERADDQKQHYGSDAA
jgi:hypothetical protein